MNKQIPDLLTGEDLEVRNHLSEEPPDNRWMLPEDVQSIVVHCTATKRSYDCTAKRLKEMHALRNFRTVGYHLYVRCNGEVYQFRRLLEVGAHCKPHNFNTVGVAYEGGLDEEGNPSDTRTEEQKERLLKILIALHELFPEATIVGHRDLPRTTPKACPCFDAKAEYGWIEEL